MNPEKFRAWGPTIDSNAGCFVDKFHVGTCRPEFPCSNEDAKKYGEQAAHCEVSTSQFVAGIEEKLLSFCPRFNTSVVASRKNQAFWPQSVNFTDVESLERHVSSALFFASSFLFENIANGKVLSSVTVPSDQVFKFLDGLARIEAKEKMYFFSDFAESLTLLPTVGRTVALADVMSTLKNNFRLISKIKTLSLISSTSGTEEDVVSPVLEKTSNLVSLTLSKCSLRRFASSMLATVQKSTIEVLHIPENDLGVEDELSDEVLAALTDLIKYDKFLTSLDLSYNNFTPAQSRAIFEALASSDTTLSPEDLPPEPEEEVVPIEEFVERNLFFPSDDKESEISEEEIDEESKEEEEENPEEEALDEQEEDELEEGEEGEEGEEENEGDDESEKDEEDTEPKVDPRIERRYTRLKKIFFHEEKKVRRDVMEEYLSEVLTVAQEILKIRERKEKEKNDKIEQYCKRRSGWSKIQKLCFRGNRLGDAGTKKLALVFRDEIKLTEEEKEKIEASLREKTEALIDELAKLRRETIKNELTECREYSRKERKERKEIEEKLAARRRRLDVHPAFVFNRKEEGGENNESVGDGESGAGTDAEEDPQELEEGKESTDIDDELGIEPELLSEREPWSYSVLPSKRGLDSVQMLDIGSCDVGSGGLKKLASVLETNRKLEILILRRNTKFAVLYKNVEVDEDAEEEGSEDDAAARREEVPNYISPGFAAFALMLRVNKYLKNIDLGYCQLSPDSLILLSSCLKDNSTLEVLNLEGNLLGGVPSQNRPLKVVPKNQEESKGELNTDVEGFSAPNDIIQPDAVLSSDASSEQQSCLFLILTALFSSQVKSLNLSNTDLSSSLNEPEASALANLSKKIDFLGCNNVGWRAEHLIRWADAIEKSVDSTSRVCIQSLQLRRNDFSADNGDGEALGRVLKHFSGLIEFWVDDNPKLFSTGVSCIAANLPSTLRMLSCARTGITTCCTADGRRVIPERLMENLFFLSLADISCNSEDLKDWVSFCQSFGNSLRFLSLWSRNLNMEQSLEPFEPMTQSLPNLLYADFGVLLRFDMDPPDVKDTLGIIERTLTARRLSLSFKEAPK